MNPYPKTIAGRLRAKQTKSILEGLSRLKEQKLKYADPMLIMELAQTEILKYLNLTWKKEITTIVYRLVIMQKVLIDCGVIQKWFAVETHQYFLHPGHTKKVGMIEELVEM